LNIEHAAGARWNDVGPREVTAPRLRVSPRSLDHI
jgi:hypothetical protein